MPAPRGDRPPGSSLDITLGAKDASALINGLHPLAGAGCPAAHDCARLMKTADMRCVFARAMRGELAAFDPRLHRAAPSRSDKVAATSCLFSTERALRRARAGRGSSPGKKGENRAPGTPAIAARAGCLFPALRTQVQGPANDALDYVEGLVSVELNAATDNPLIVDDGAGGYVSLSGGHFHGQYMAQAMDVLAIAMTDLGAISERRLARLIDPGMSYGLPRNLLAGKQGLNTGFATVQCSMSALVMENRGLATPGSVDSIPGKSNAEDHVSNSTWCGRKARAIVENVEQIVAGELLMAAQALSLVAEVAEGYPLGKGLAGRAGRHPRNHPARPRGRSLVRPGNGRRPRPGALGRGDRGGRERDWPARVMRPVGEAGRRNPQANGENRMRIFVLTGAGISAESGTGHIPRSRRDLGTFRPDEAGHAGSLRA